MPSLRLGKREASQTFRRASPDLGSSEGRTGSWAVSTKHGTPSTLSVLQMNVLVGMEAALGR
jgi:hypothetical protein